MKELLTIDLGVYKVYTALSIIPVGVSFSVEPTSVAAISDSQFDKFFVETYGKDVKNKIIEYINHG